MWTSQRLKTSQKQRPAHARARRRAAKIGFPALDARSADRQHSEPVTDLHASALYIRRTDRIMRGVVMNTITKHATAGILACFLALVAEGAAPPNLELSSPRDQISYSIGINLGAGWKSDEQDVDLPSFLRGVQEGLLSSHDERSKASYSLGFSLGNSWKHQGFDMETNRLEMGIQDALQARAPRLSEREMRDVMTAFRRDLRLRLLAKMREKNLRESEAFLAENRAKEGVVILPSGVQYRVLRPGTGPCPSRDDTVVVHYRGTLIDGGEFDSSRARNEPATFPVNSVIPGWSEALLRMPVGAQWQVAIPPHLAYGTNGSPPLIEPNAALLFDIELLQIRPRPGPSNPSP